MEIASLPLGPIGTNCYIVYEPGEDECFVVDPGDEPRTVIRKLDSIGVVPKYILITHGHPDHTGGVAGLKREFPDAVVMIHEADNDKLGAQHPGTHLEEEGDAPVADAFFRDGEELDCGSMRLRVIHTPGHSPGGVSLYAEEGECLFAGDTLFRASVGRWDFPGGDYDALESSIRDKLYKLPPATVVYPGHSSATSIGEEIQYNPFIRADNAGD